VANYVWADVVKGQIADNDAINALGNQVELHDAAINLGAWVAWTPTLTNLTLGSGTVIAKYSRVGKMLDFRFKFTLGAGSAVGSLPRFSLPFAAHSEYAVTADKAGWGSAADSGITDYDVSLRFVVDQGSVEFVTIGTNGQHAAVSATVPFTFGSGDSLFAAGRLELA